MLARRLGLLAAAAVLIGATVPACSARGGGPGTSRSGTSRSARPYGTPGVRRTTRPSVGAARVGALFSGDRPDHHFCTASIVDSPGDSVIVTAAHCVPDGASGLVFVPGYRDGHAPYGRWPVRHVVVDPRWTHGADPDYDVAFADVAAVHGRRVGDVYGGNRFGHDRGYRLPVELTGYPSAGEQPVSCGNDTTRYSAGQLRIACPGFPGGTSGSPWVTDLNRHTHTGTVVGVIGGHHGGGDTPDVSYSPYFGAAVRALYRTAVRDER